MTERKRGLPHIFLQKTPKKFKVCIVLSVIYSDFTPFKIRKIFRGKTNAIISQKIGTSHLGKKISNETGGTMINNMVLSREIEWIGYEHKRSMLQVEFIVGAIYQYENVPETVYQEFLTAPSHGRFFESNIKNKYQVRKIR